MKMQKLEREMKNSKIRSDLDVHFICPISDASSQRELKDRAMDTADQQNIYRSAIALNNMGVSMLTRYQYEAAMGMLQDAIYAFKVALHLLELSDADSSISSEVHLKAMTMLPTWSREVEVRLGRATLRVSALDRRSQECNADTRGIDFLPAVHILSDREDDDVSMVMCLKETRQTSHANPSSWETGHFAIRIDPIDYQSIVERDIDVDSSIMLHNYGVSCELVAEKLPETKAQRAQQLQASAIRSIRGGFETMLFKLSECKPCIPAPMAEACPDEKRERLECSPIVVALLIRRGVQQIELGRIDHRCLKEQDHMGFCNYEAGNLVSNQALASQQQINQSKQRMLSKVRVAVWNFVRSSMVARTYEATSPAA